MGSHKSLVTGRFPRIDCSEVPTDWEVQLKECRITLDGHIHPIGLPIG